MYSGAQIILSLFFSWASIAYGQGAHNAKVREWMEANGYLGHYRQPGPGRDAGQRYGEKRRPMLSIPQNNLWIQAGMRKDSDLNPIQYLPPSATAPWKPPPVIRFFKNRVESEVKIMTSHEILRETHSNWMNWTKENLARMDLNSDGKLKKDWAGHRYPWTKDIQWKAAQGYPQPIPFLVKGELDPEFMEKFQYNREHRDEHKKQWREEFAERFEKHKAAMIEGRMNVVTGGKAFPNAGPTPFPHKQINKIRITDKKKTAWANIPGCSFWRSHRMIDSASGMQIRGGARNLETYGHPLLDNGFRYKNTSALVEYFAGPPNYKTKVPHKYGMPPRYLKNGLPDWFNKGNFTLRWGALKNYSDGLQFLPHPFTPSMKAKTATDFYLPRGEMFEYQMYKINHVSKEPPPAWMLTTPDPWSRDLKFKDQVYSKIVKNVIIPDPEGIAKDWTQKDWDEYVPGFNYKGLGFNIPVEGDAAPAKLASHSKTSTISARAVCFLACATLCGLAFALFSVRKPVVSVSKPLVLPELKPVEDV